MVSPITRFAIKGVIWYQGCANGNLHNSAMGATYTDKMDALVSSWRSLWGYEFPFYWVQLASFTRKTTDPAGGNGYAYIRQAQFNALSRIKNGGMAVTIDIGNDRDIHPKAKKQVGERLARWALARDYGKDIVPSGPLFKSAKSEEGKIRISFDYVGTGLMVGVKKATDNLEPQEAPKGTPLKGFAIAGKDKVYCCCHHTEKDDPIKKLLHHSTLIFWRKLFRKQPCLRMVSVKTLYSGSFCGKIAAIIRYYA